MKDNLTKALAIVIRALEEKSVNHDWYNHSECNVGLVSQALTGKTASQVAKMIPGGKGTWSEKVNKHCSLTGQTSKEIFRILLTKGLTREDIIHLEYLSDKRILKRAGMRFTSLFSGYNKNPKNLLRYLKAWKELREQDIRENKNLLPTQLDTTEPVRIAEFTEN